MTDKPTQSVEKREPVSVEYIPYGAQDKLKLSVSIVQNLVAVKTKSGKTCSDRDAMKFLAMCQAKRMNPFEGDCFLIGYDTKDGAVFALVTAHQTYLKRAELHPEFDGMKSGVIVRDIDGALKDLEGDFYEEGQEILGGWATVFFKSRKQPMHKRIRLARFQKPFGIWQEDPAGMVCKCAEADALRSSFPTMLGGLYLREEMDIPSMKVSRPDFGPSKPLSNGTKPSVVVEGTSFLSPAGETKEPEPAKNPAPAEPQQPGIPAEPVPMGGFNPIKAVRNLCKMARIKEGELLTQLAADGTTDGSCGTLEELAMSQNGQEILRAVSEDWPDLVARLAQKEGAA